MNDQTHWIATQLNADSVTLDAVRSSPISETFLVQAGDTRAYFKECRGPAAHEPVLMALMHDAAPDVVPAVLGVDAARGWVLLADAGPTVREVIRADGDQSHSIKMLSALGSLQTALIPLTGKLAALGVPDRRLERLPALYDELIADTDWLIGMRDADLARVCDFALQLRDLCAQLGALNLPYTLHHDDFHSGNVAVIGNEYRIFDFGESFISLLGASLLIALRDAKYILKYDQAMLDSMQSEAIGGWSHVVDPADLRAALSALFQVAALHRALTWKELLKLADESTLAEDGDAITYWLMTCVNNTPLEA